MSLELNDRIDGLNFGAEKSMRYHQRRRAHFERLHRGTMFAVVVTGSAGAAGFFGSPEFFALVAAVLGALDLVFAFSVKAQQHELLFKRFSILAKEIRSNSSPTEGDYQNWVNNRLDIESEEPTVYWAVEASCYNEVVVAWGRETSVELNRLGFWEGVLMHWWPYEATNFGPHPAGGHADLPAE